MRFCIKPYAFYCGIGLHATKLDSKKEVVGQSRSTASFLLGNASQIFVPLGKKRAGHPTQTSSSARSLHT
jgi:hypothetical protein